MKGFTILLRKMDLVTIGNTADTMGPGGAMNPPFTAVQTVIIK